jgi:hypothetical protein
LGEVFLSSGLFGPAAGLLPFFQVIIGQAELFDLFKLMEEENHTNVLSG